MSAKWASDVEGGDPSEYSASTPLQERLALAFVLVLVAACVTAAAAFWFMVINVAPAFVRLAH